LREKALAEQFFGGLLNEISEKMGEEPSEKMGEEPIRAKA
jgi:hypothetical protein